MKNEYQGSLSSQVAKRDERQVGEHERVLAHPPHVVDRQRGQRLPGGDRRPLVAGTVLPASHRPPHAHGQLDREEVVDRHQSLRHQQQDQKVLGAHRLIERQQPQTAEHDQVCDPELRPHQCVGVAARNRANGPVDGVDHGHSLAAGLVSGCAAGLVSGGAAGSPPPAPTMARPATARPATGHRPGARTARRQRRRGRARPETSDDRRGSPGARSPRGRAARRRWRRAPGHGHRRRRRSGTRRAEPRRRRRPRPASRRSSRSYPPQK